MIEIFPSLFSRGTSVKVDTSGRNAVIAMGDSFTQSQGASPASLGYINRLISLYGYSLNNLSISGKGMWASANAIQAVSFTRSSSILTVLCGFNDLRRGGTDARTLRKIEAGLRAIILKGLASVNTPSGSASVTRSGGTFAGYAASSVGGNLPGGTLPGNFASFTSDGGDWTWTFTGTAFGIQFIANSGDVQTFGVADIYIDSVLTKSVDLNIWYDNITDGTYDNRRGPLAFTFHGLANTSHTIEVRTTSGIVPVDFFSVLQTIPNSAAFLFSEIPYMDATGYAVSPANGSDAIFDSGSTVIRNLVSEYRALGYNIAFVKWNQFYNVATDLDTDHIHPNNTGHLHGFNAFRAALSS